MSKGSLRGGTSLQLEDSPGAPRRGSVDKSKAARAFNRDGHHTKAINTARAPMRGGWRL